MHLLHFIQSLLGGNQQQGQAPVPARAPRPRTQAQINSAPFKMYEDNSFQGNPRQFMATHPGYTFYEDNTFTAPGLPVAQAQGMQPHNVPYEDSFTPTEALFNTGYFNPQTSLHGNFVQPMVPGLQTPNYGKQKLQVLQQAYRNLR